MSDKIDVYSPIYNKIEDWPIFKLSEDREAFVKEINEYTLKRLTRKSADELNDILATTIYRERIRIKEEPWKVDPPDDRLFWKKIRKKLIRKSLDKEEEEAHESNTKLLETIIGRYSEEIVGTFKIPTFKFARRFLTGFLNRLLNTAASRNFKRVYSSRYHLYERLKVTGEIETIRSLFKKGTVVVVPTHFSNLDSMIIGYVMDAILGWPSFSYGAGLNLYNTGYTAYFMNRLGAYRLDRRKKNPIYLETLKAMSTLSIERGTNSLFFPGGTRSRSGALEDKLKMGLLGTSIEAQRIHFEKGKKEKVFIVPLIMSYHFVLEAPFLIEQHLKKTGKEQYMHLKDASYSYRKILKFIWQLFSQQSDSTFSFGKPMDVLGNFVDADGNSFDQHGKEINVADYFISNGKITKNLQREFEYTKILAQKIGDRFLKDNVVLSSHLIAYTAFNILLHQNSNLDIYGVLRLPTEDYMFPFEALKNGVIKLQKILFEMQKKEQIKLSPEIHFDVERLIKDGIKNLGLFHTYKPLKINKQKHIISEDFKVLFYYHNRLENYNLARHVQWSKLELEQI